MVIIFVPQGIVPFLRFIFDVTPERLVWCKPDVRPLQNSMVSLGRSPNPYQVLNATPVRCLASIRVGFEITNQIRLSCFGLLF